MLPGSGCYDTFVVIVTGGGLRLRLGGKLGGGRNPIYARGGKGDTSQERKKEEQKKVAVTLLKDKKKRLE